MATVLIVVAIFLPQDLGMKAPASFTTPWNPPPHAHREADLPEEGGRRYWWALEEPTAIAGCYIRNIPTVCRNQSRRNRERPQGACDSLKTHSFWFSADLGPIPVMWGGIFNLAVEASAKYTAQASRIFMMMVVGGGVMPLIQNAIAGSDNYMGSYWLVVAMLAYLLFYGWIGAAT